MPAYQPFTSPRTTEPDATSLLAQLRALDATAGVQHMPGSGQWVIKKTTDWTANQITAAQRVIDTAPDASSELTAQAIVDNWPIETRALVLTLIDQLNIIRAALPIPLGAITPAQALAAIRAKAATL